MQGAQTVITLTPQTLPIFLSIFGDLHAADKRLGDRSAVRRPSRAAIEFLRVHSAGDPEMCAGQCLDISEGGIGFTCADHVRPGEKIQIFMSGETQDYSMTAEVVHATRTPKGTYRVGAKYRWD